MTSAEHYAEAERLLTGDSSHDIQRALVHAELALAAATAPDRVEPPGSDEFPFPFPFPEEGGPPQGWGGRPHR